MGKEGDGWRGDFLTGNGVLLWVRSSLASPPSYSTSWISSLGLTTREGFTSLAAATPSLLAAGLATRLVIGGVSFVSSLVPLAVMGLALPALTSAVSLIVAVTLAASAGTPTGFFIVPYPTFVAIFDAAIFPSSLGGAATGLITGTFNGPVAYGMTLVAGVAAFSVALVVSLFSFSNFNF